jgi:hypothetical protein
MTTRRSLKEDNEQGSQGNPAGQSEIKKQKGGVDGDESTTDQTDDFVNEDDGEPEGKDADEGKLSFGDVQKESSDDDEDTDKKFPFKNKDEEDGLKEDDDEDDKNPFGKKTDEDGSWGSEKEPKNVVKESFKVRIKLPKAPLFESVDKSQRKQVAAIFEQAIRSNTKSIAKQLTEHFNAKFKTQIARRDAVLAKQVDAYSHLRHRRVGKGEQSCCQDEHPHSACGRVLERSALAHEGTLHRRSGEQD